MKIRDLSAFLFLQIITVPVVILIFKFVTPRNVAGICAGLVFIFVSAFFIWRSLKWEKFYTKPVFYFSAIHLFVIALPMFFMRILYFNTPFEELNIWGIAAPTFHKLSEKLFALLMFSTVWEMFALRATISKKKQEP